MRGRIAASQRSAIPAHSHYFDMTHPTQITAAEFAQFQALIHKIAGINLSDAKQILLVGRLGRRLKHYGLSSYTEYYKLVTSSQHAGELQQMVDLLTTNETYFFRESKHFEYLAQHILPKHPPGRSFDVWSAASSTGEEIYTIAMVLADTLGLKGQWNVTGSDISRSVLAVAERGQYWLDRVRGLPPDYLRKYCLKGVKENEGSFIIMPELRRHTRFLQANLNGPLPGLGKFHVIFLRNVMIYFDNDTKRKVVERLVQHLHPGGHLIIGHSESLNNITNCVKPIKPTIYQAA
ncbi:chemotaxis regulator, protein-glutamate methyltransferase [Sterolibacterium denitrificans]|uniref:Chemotaxis protein methyltransferase n=1 Tax=Sterolibacterium denitrificans TaxID=157592 RepID=A0A7Z7HSD0_9PROT|nr:chemotaxis regulator, protein-glutamate methyltransferase [Sterolibacterium denitrificans]